VSTLATVRLQIYTQLIGFSKQILGFFLALKIYEFPRFSSLSWSIGDLALAIAGVAVGLRGYGMAKCARFRS
jgi:hypothetical protein